MNVNPQQYISELVAKLLDGSITKNEFDKLLRFFLNNQEIENWPDYLGSKEEVKERIHEKIRLGLHFGKPESIRVIPFYKKSLFKYAVAASLVLFVTFTAIFKLQKQDVLPVANSHKIEIGTDKATLTLEDGTNVILGNGKTYADKNLNSTGKELLYKESGVALGKVTYNYLTVPRGGQYYLKLSDGTQVWLNSESQLKFPTSFIEGKTRVVELVYGEAYFEVSPSTQNNGSHFKVFTKKQVVEVLGTQFNIKAYKDEAAIYTTLVEGKVMVTSAGNVEKMVPGQQLICDVKSQALTFHQTDVSNEISWKRGVFSFERKSLKEIMTVLSRWYDFKVIFTKPEIEKKEFVGVLGRNQKIEEILNTLKEFGNIKDYEIKDKTIILK